MGGWEGEQEVQRLTVFKQYHEQLMQMSQSLINPNHAPPGQRDSDDARHGT